MAAVLSLPVSLPGLSVSTALALLVREAAFAAEL